MGENRGHEEDSRTPRLLHPSVIFPIVPFVYVLTGGDLW
jgi:hypothetical protein